MKTVYINSNVLEEGVLMNALPDDIVATIDRKKTAFGANPAFPNTFDTDFIEIVANKRLSELSKKLKSIGSIDFVKSNKPAEALAELMNMAIKIETPNRVKLEKLCLNTVIDLFGIPDDMIDIELTLTDKIDINTKTFQVDKVYDSDTEYDSFDFIEDINREVYKRRVINALSFGAGMEISSNIGKYASELFEINPRLTEIYRDIILLNSYLVFTKDDVGISDENKMQSGTVELKLGGDDDKILISAQGKIFPILLCEVIRGLMELFSLHGLPTDISMLREVLVRSDYFKAEAWDMRIGVELWRLLTDSIGEFDNRLLPYIFSRICKLDIDNFNRLMKSVFARTSEGKRLMASIVELSKEDFEELDDSEKAQKQNIDKSVITDEFLREEEL